MHDMCDILPEFSNFPRRLKQIYTGTFCAGRANQTSTPSSLLAPCSTRALCKRTTNRGGGKQKVAKAYGVFMDEEMNKKYHFFLDHPVSHTEYVLSSRNT